jgi:hypothetical protein
MTSKNAERSTTAKSALDLSAMDTVDSGWLREDPAP